MTTPAKKTMANFLAIPQTKDFLKENLNNRSEEFVSNLLALSGSDSKIAECDPKDVMLCAMNATALNLPLNKNLGLAYVIAYKGVPSFQIGYKGFIQLAIRTGQYKFLNAVEVRDGEIDRNKFTGEIKFNGDLPENKIVGYLAYLELMNGFRSSLYMTVDEVKEHTKRYSKSYQYDIKYNKKSSLWSNVNEFPKMAKKTVLKSLISTFGILTTEMSKAFDNDTNSEAQYNSRNTVDTDAEIVEQKDPAEEIKTIGI